MSESESPPVGGQPAGEPATAVQGAAGDPLTGDIVIDAALRDLTSADPRDLDAQIQRAESLQRTLQGRLADLGD